MYVVWTSDLAVPQIDMYVSLCARVYAAQLFAGCVWAVALGCVCLFFEVSAQCFSRKDSKHCDTAKYLHVYVHVPRVCLVIT